MKLGPRAPPEQNKHSWCSYHLEGSSFPLAPRRLLRTSSLHCIPAVHPPLGASGTARGGACLQTKSSFLPAGWQSGESCREEHRPVQGTEHSWHSTDSKRSRSHCFPALQRTGRSQLGALGTHAASPWQSWLHCSLGKLLPCGRQRESPSWLSLRISGVRDHSGLRLPPSLPGRDHRAAPIQLSLTGQQQAAGAGNV